MACPISSCNFSQQLHLVATKKPHISEAGMKPHKKREPPLQFCSQKALMLRGCCLIHSSPRPQETQLLCTELPSTSPIIKLHILKRTEMFFTYYGKISNISSVTGSFLKSKHRFNSHRYCYQCFTEPLRSERASCSH